MNIMSASIKKFSEELMSLFPFIGRALHGGHTDALGKGTITVPQFFCLELVEAGGPLKMNEVAAQLHISLPAATGLINRLHSMGMVKRIYDPSDRRVIRISITPKGEGAIKEVVIQKRRAIEKVFSCLSERERNEYLRIIKKMRKALHDS
jgi:DNA-binding MarR family transcriptional regulator